MQSLTQRHVPTEVFHRTLFHIVVAPALLTALFLLSGCLTSQIGPMQPYPAEPRLIATLRHAAPISITTKLPSGHFLGNQFLFVLLPFGVIRLEDPKLLFENKLRQQLALRGLSISPSSSPQWSLTVEAASLNAFDLLLFRRVSCQIDIVARHPGSAEEAIQVNKAHIVRFAFKPLLQRHFDRCLSEAIDEAVAKTAILSPPISN